MPRDTLKVSSRLGWKWQVGVMKAAGLLGSAGGVERDDGVWFFECATGEIHLGSSIFEDNGIQMCCLSPLWRGDTKER